MGATILPWWDDWWSVKPNEFERGVMTGMVLKCGKSDEPEPTKPEGAVGEWSVKYLFKGGAKIETWVTDDGTKEYNGTLFEQVYLHQRKTYSDGVVDEYITQLATTPGRGISLNQGWEFVFDEPINNSIYNGVIVSGTLRYWLKTKPETVYKIGVNFKWGIPTAEPTVVI